MKPAGALTGPRRFMAAECPGGGAAMWRRAGVVVTAVVAVDVVVTRARSGPSRTTRTRW